MKLIKTAFFEDESPTLIYKIILAKSLSKWTFITSSIFLGNLYLCGMAKWSFRIEKSLNWQIIKCLNSN